MSERTQMSQTSGTVAVLVRTSSTAAFAYLGFVTGTRLVDAGILSGVQNLAYLAVLGGLVGWLVGAPLASAADRWWTTRIERLGGVDPGVVLSAGAGATVGLLTTVLLDAQLSRIPGFSWVWSLGVTVVLVTATSTFFVRFRDALPFRSAEAPVATRQRTEVGHGRLRLLDTSALIDGRLTDVVDARFLDGRLGVPAFVLGELQRVADEGDPLKRRRGRRGLAELERLSAHEDVQFEVTYEDFDGAQDVDGKLVGVCRRMGADLVTTDYALHQIAQLQGVRVLNLHALAAALKPRHLPGETMTVTLEKPGREEGQAIAYLDDGTMIVVERGAERIGHELDVVVTSSVQTSVGRMIFSKVQDGT